MHFAEQNNMDEEAPWGFTTKHGGFLELVAKHRVELA